MTKKLLAVLVAGALAGCGIAACGNNPDRQSNEGVTDGAGTVTQNPGGVTPTAPTQPTVTQPQRQPTTGG